MKDLHDIGTLDDALDVIGKLESDKAKLKRHIQRGYRLRMELREQEEQFLMDTAALLELAVAEPVGLIEENAEPKEDEPPAD